MNTIRTCILEASTTVETFSITTAGPRKAGLAVITFLTSITTGTSLVALIGCIKPRGSTVEGLLVRTFGATKAL